MSKALKYGIFGVAGIVVILLILVFFVWSQLNSIVKAAIEQVGSDVTGTEVVLGAVDIDLTSGHGALRGFQVVNPRGFARDDAFAFDEVSMTIDVATVTSDPVIVKEIVIDGPRIAYELAPKGNNLDTIKGNVDKNTGGGASSSESSKGPKIIIENMYFRNGEVSVAATEFIDRKLSVPLPDLHLRNLGKDDGGVGPAAIAEQTFDGLYDSTVRAIGSANINLDDLRQGLGEATRQVEEGARDAIEGAGKAADDAGKAVEEGAGDALNKLKGVFD